MSWVFANGPGDRGPIPGRVIPKTQIMVLDAALVNTQSYKVVIKDKVERSREWSDAFLYTSVVAIEKGAFGSPLTTVAKFTIIDLIDEELLFLLTKFSSMALGWLHYLMLISDHPSKQ